MGISLIICTYKRAEAMKVLLGSLRKQNVSPDEILVIDASLDELTAELVAEEQKSWSKGSLFYFKAPPEHRGLTKQRNYGVVRATSEIIAFLDDDTVPEPNYFQEIRNCFEKYPDCHGVGGFITNEVEWSLSQKRKSKDLTTFQYGGWEVRESYRWKIRKLLGLESPIPPGWVPEFGHGRPVNFIPPDGKDHKVETLMGGASAWRKEVFQKHNFSTFFEGYGLYEDFDFCVRVSRQNPLYLCTKARLAHYHAPTGRPDSFLYGKMVVRNGWFVWRRRWSNPNLKNQLRWWAITYLLIILRLIDVRDLSTCKSAFLEGCGRLWGAATLLWDKPREN